MVLVDPAGYPMTLPWPLKLASLPVIKHVAAMITPRVVFAMSLKQVFGDPGKITDDMIDRHYELSLRPGNRTALMHIMASLKKINADPDFSRAITDISVPTLLLWGGSDQWIPVSHVKLWKRDLPGIHVIVYDGVGHIPQVEIPEQSARDVHQWLSATSARDTGSMTPGRLLLLSILAGIPLVALIVYLVLKKKTTA